MNSTASENASSEASRPTGSSDGLVWPAGLNWRWICIVPAGLVLLLAMSMRVEGTDQVFLPFREQPLPPSCTAQLLLGIPCPSCGMTRGMIAMGHGDWTGAWQFNPASLVMFVFLAIMIPWQLWQLDRIRRGLRPWGNLWNFSPLVVIVAVMIVQWIVKLGALDLW